MAILSGDGKYVTVQKNDNLWNIARDYLGSGEKYKQLAAINNISNPNLIYVNQKIYLYSGSGSSSTTSTSNSTTPVIKQFGVQSNAENTLFATWSFGRDSETDSYKAEWSYDTGDGLWFISSKTISVDTDNYEASKQDTFNIPSNAKKVRFRVKPIAKKETKNNKETSKYSGQWSAYWTPYWTDGTPLDTPNIPDVQIEKYQLTASLDSVRIVGATKIEFEVVKDNNATVYRIATADIITEHASHVFTVDAGGLYKVRCRAVDDSKNYSEWTAYSANYETIPSAPSGITTIRATSETAVYLEWDEVESADSYEIEYATKKEQFDNSDQPITKPGIEYPHYEISGLESGQEYFFRVRARNEKGESPWSELSSVVVGKDPAAPTTWSSTTTAITGEPLTLYWVHNTEDGSSQTYAELELTINGVLQQPSITIKNSTDEDEKDKTSSYSIDTSEFIEGTTLQWRVRTAGITNTYGDWSIQRTIDIYAPATLTLSMTDIDGNQIQTLSSFPFYIYGLAGPNTQRPIGYHLSIRSNETYDTVDSVGNEVTISKDQEVYSKYFDIQDSLLVEFSAHNIDLENTVTYTVNCDVSMNSGLTGNASLEFDVSWMDLVYEPNAEIGVSTDDFTASIRPYCIDTKIATYKVSQNGDSYIITDEKVESAVWGEPIIGVKTTTGEIVYSGVTEDDVELMYAAVEEVSPITNVYLSVYRREFDGSFVELATGLDGAKSTTVTDPHPSLDYARYRIVATDKDTGAVSFNDLPGYPVGGIAAILQWDEEWTNFEATDDAELAQPPWSGSLLKLPYNIDIHDNNNPDVENIKYIGRSHPVAYYGTQLGSTSSWSMEIVKSDKETLYGLRRLARWMGNVYVREPSGSGYWANVQVSFSQKHRDLTIPVALSITRVEGGM